MSPPKQGGLPAQPSDIDTEFVPEVAGRITATHLYHLNAQVIELMATIQEQQHRAAEQASQLSKLTQTLEDLPAKIAAANQAAMIDAAKHFLEDKKMVASFWEAGYTHLVKHFGDNASQYVGRRILMAAATVAFVLSITWMVKIGALK